MIGETQDFGVRLTYLVSNSAALHVFCASTNYLTVFELSFLELSFLQMENGGNK